MVVRRRKKKNKLRGSRTHGKGDTKRKRGAGCRGGRGRAGAKGGHKFSKYYKEFGKKIRLKSKKVKFKRYINTINLDELNLLIEKLNAENKLKKEDKYILIDGAELNFDKILGRGSIDYAIKISNAAASKKAIEKIKAAGGIFEGGAE